MSEIRVTTLKDTSGGNSSTTAQVFSGRAKAWVNFDGTGAIAIRANFNVNSITDNGTGDYTVNFSNAMSDANYAVTATSADTSAIRAPYISPKDTTNYLSGSVRLDNWDFVGNRFDSPVVSFATFR